MSGNQTGISISREQFDALKEAVERNDFTRYHYLKSQYGSALSTLYVPGPTGQGLFGTISHEYTQRFIGSEQFKSKQAEISKEIADRELRFIASTRDGLTYRLPSVSKTIELEIASWKALDFPAESYAGNLLDWFIGSKVEGAMISPEIFGAGGAAVVLSLAENWVTGDVIVYKNVTYATSALTLRDGFYFAQSNGVEIPIGIAADTMVKALHQVVQTNFMEHSPELFLGASRYHVAADGTVRDAEGLRQVARNILGQEKYDDIVASLRSTLSLDAAGTVIGERVWSTDGTRFDFAVSQPQPDELTPGLRGRGVSGLTDDVFTTAIEAANLSLAGDLEGASKLMAQLGARVLFGLEAGAVAKTLADGIGSAGGAVGVITQLVGSLTGSVLGTVSSDYGRPNDGNAAEKLAQSIWSAADAVGEFLRDPTAAAFEKIGLLPQAIGVSTRYGNISPEVTVRVQGVVSAFMAELAARANWDRSISGTGLTTSLNRMAAYQRSAAAVVSLTPARMFLNMSLSTNAKTQFGAGDEKPLAPDVTEKANYIQKIADRLVFNVDVRRATGKSIDSLSAELARIEGALQSGDAGRIKALAAEYEAKDVAAQKAAKASEDARKAREAELAAAEAARQKQAEQDRLVGERRTYLETVRSRLATSGGTQASADLRKIRTALESGAASILAVSAEFMARDARYGNGTAGSGSIGYPGRGNGGGSGGGSGNYYSGGDRHNPRKSSGWDRPSISVESVKTGAKSSNSRPPVLLDLDGDGHIDFRPFDATEFAAGGGPRFDWDGDGVQDGTAWVGPSDGWLAIDLSADGGAGPDSSIRQAKELSFAMWAPRPDPGGDEVTDLEALRLIFDTNHNNLLDPGDARWSEFRVWQDINQNGVSDVGELRTLDEANIRLIDLVPSSEGRQLFADGSSIVGTSTYLRTDGSRALVGDATVVYRSGAELSVA